jgi:hypothetical protein
MVEGEASATFCIAMEMLMTLPFLLSMHFALQFPTLSAFHAPSGKG